jgi:DNA-directed RNA polymerase subunit beta
LSNYARINDFGIIETPYVKVKDGKITKDVVYMNALEEERHIIAHAGNVYDEDGKLAKAQIEARVQGAASTC